MLNFLFTRPQHFDRLARHGFGNHDRLSRKVLWALSAQATAQLHRVHFHIGLRHACRSRTDRQCGFWILSGRPDFQFVTLQPCGTHHGFHGGMCQIGREVISFNHLSCFRHCLGCIAIVARHSQFALLHARFKVRHDDRAAQGAVLANVPLD